MSDLGGDSVNPEATAIISDDGVYRYRLRRHWGLGQRRVLFGMLNPSTADHAVNDPTVRRCIGFARAWGYDGVDVVNGGAFRATNPKDLLTAPDPIGPDNERHVRAAADEAALIVAAWGSSYPPAMAAWMRRFAAILSESRPVFALGVTKSGDPRHPLYVRSDAALIPWSAHV